MKSKEVFCKYTINNTILNILFILFYNVLKTLKWKYMLNLTSYKTSKAVPPISAIIADLTLFAFVGVHHPTYTVLHGYFSLGKAREPKAKAAGSKVLF